MPEAADVISPPQTADVPLVNEKSRPVTLVPAVRAGIGRVLRHVVSSEAVVTRWDEAHTKVVEGLPPGKMRDAFLDHRDSWHRIAKAFGVTASVVDGTLMAMMAGLGIKPLLWAGAAGKSVEPGSSTQRHLNITPAKSALRQVALGVTPWVALSGAVGALRPTRRALEGAGWMAGTAGRPVAQIVDRILFSP